MKCPLCSKDEDRVIESRQNRNATTIRRRRECRECGNRFTTYERIEEAPIMVIKRSGRREIFKREKVEHGILKALEKRTIAADAVEEIIQGVEDEAASISYSTHEIRSENIGNLVLHHLFSHDKVAYIRFASVYRHFSDVGEFIQIIEKLKNSGSDQEPAGGFTDRLL